MNRSRGKDSEFSLDGATAEDQLPRMSEALEHLQVLVLRKVGPRRSCARYYVLRVEPCLFGGASVVREWGRIGSKPRRRIELHATVRDAAVSLDAWLERKQRRGYRSQAVDLGQLKSTSQSTCE